MTPEEFYWHCTTTILGHDEAIRQIAARDAEVRKDERAKVIEECDQFYRSPERWHSIYHFKEDLVRALLSRSGSDDGGAE